MSFPPSELEKDQLWIVWARYIVFALSLSLRYGAINNTTGIVWKLSEHQQNIKGKEKKNRLSDV